MAKRRFRWGRFLLVTAGISAAIVMCDGLRRDLHRSNTGSIVVNGNFADEDAEVNAEKPIDGTVDLANDSQPTTFLEGIQNLTFSDFKVSEAKLNSGMLAIINDEHPAGDLKAGNSVDLLNHKNEYYTLVSESVKLNKDAAEALNHMMADYNEATGLADFIVYGTNDTYTGEGSLCPEKFTESVTGYTVDLAVNSGYGALTFDGCDTEGWITDNCAKYGFIVRFPDGKDAKTGHEFCPWHLRYVGEVHAAIMDEKNLCLEEYVDFLRGYSFDNTFSYTSDGVKYEIYTSEAEKDTTSVRVPSSGKYEISGDNIGTYIITTEKN